MEIGVADKARGILLGGVNRHPSDDRGARCRFMWITRRHRPACGHWGIGFRPMASRSPSVAAFSISSSLIIITPTASVRMSPVKGSPPELTNETDGAAHGRSLAAPDEHQLRVDRGGSSSLPVGALSSAHRVDQFHWKRRLMPRAISAACMRTK